MSKVWDYKSNENDKLSKKIQSKGIGFIYTNIILAKDLIDNHTNILEGDTVCEPCKGNGSFYNQLPDNCNKIWYEINEGKDYLTCEEKCDITLSNPPFVPRKLFWSFHQKAMELTNREIYWLINFCSINVFTPKRLDEMKSKGWFINSFHVVADKRWFGRYAWIKISKIDNNFMSWKRKSY